MRLFAGLMFVSFNLWAMDWNDLEVSSHYKLTQSFQLPQLERSGSLLDLSSGDEFVLKDIVGLDMINVSLYQFEYKNCPGSELKTDMEIIPVKDTAPMIEVGAQVDKCVLEIFIENKDVLTKSFFE